MNNFDSVAPYYDRLSRLVFGKAIQRAQIAYLPDITPGANVLLLGGGTGWLLYELRALNPTARIWYIDASAKMIELSREMNRKTAHNIVFIHGTEDSIPPGTSFDAVITNFYLDLFQHDSCADAIRKIRSAIRPNGLWLVSDFLNTTWWHGVMLGVMYRFFKLTSDIEGSKLPEWKNLLQENALTEIKSREFFGGFIRSAVFRLNK
jgi:ubiquinone/menaquinone biosynthesis C-methylase UbiE